jgi:hypothetical protein
MCICLNCKYVLSCKTYYLIEELHNESHLTQNATFFPQSTVITVDFTISNLKNANLEWDVNECLSYEEKPANWVGKILIS